MVDLQKVYRVTAKGRTYYYAWRNGPRLHAAPGTPEFVAELQAVQETRKAGDPDKVSGLCARYRASDEWNALAASTRRNWSRWLDRIQDHFGPLSLRLFDKPAIRTDIRRWRDGYKKKPRAADYGMQVLSRLMSFAVAEGRLSVNPCRGVASLYRADRSDLIWTDDDLEAVFATASPELVRAFKLAMLTGLREADLLKLSWTHVRGLAIEMRTGKSRGRKRAIIPVYAELEALLKSIPRAKDATTILVNTKGKPWRSGFVDSWRDAVARAAKKRPEVADLHFHDLRGTFATKAYQAELSIREIAEILAWSEDRVERLIDRYVKRDELLKARIAKLDEARAKKGEAP